MRNNIKCKCSSLPDVFYLDDGPNGFQNGLTKIDKDTQNSELFECPDCGTLWAIDTWDKYWFQVVGRIQNRNAWTTSVSEEKRKELLLRSRGGTTDEECIWNNCKKKRVKGVVYCIDHLYETGARK